MAEMPPSQELPRWECPACRLENLAWSTRCGHCLSPSPKIGYQTPPTAHQLGIIIRYTETLEFKLLRIRNALEQGDCKLAILISQEK